MKKNTYIKGFFAIVAVLAAVRFGFKIGGNDIGADSPSETTTASTVSPDNPENPETINKENNAKRIKAIFKSVVRENADDLARPPRRNEYSRD